jgi:hypothetical protein
MKLQMTTQLTLHTTKALTADVLAREANNQPVIDAGPDGENEANIDAETDQRHGAKTAPYNDWARKPRDYSHMHAMLEETVMTQHSMKQGLKEFGDADVDAVLKEL